MAAAAAVVGGALLNAGGAFLSTAVNELATKLGSKVVDFFIGKEDIVKLVKDLKTMLFSADLLLIDAEEKLIKDQAVKKWLDDLKETVYELEDLVYKIDTEALREELEGESQRSCICKLIVSNQTWIHFKSSDNIKRDGIFSMPSALLFPCLELHFPAFSLR